MEKVLPYFLLVFFTAITIEAIYSSYSKRKLYNTKDSLVNFALGISGAVLRTLTKGIWLIFWTYLYQFSLIQIPENAYTYIILFLCNELVYYWFHRLSHEHRYLWAVHVNHHSSEYLNFSTAARTPFLNLILHNIFWIPLLIIGFNPTMIFIVETISFLFAFVQHTQIIKNFKYVDFILNTPMHHRIHHASNKEYINTNYGNVLIIYDRLFGTFRNEEKDISITYGITKNIKTYNIIKVIFHEWISIYKDFRLRQN